MARAKSPIGTKNVSRLCTAHTSNRSIKFTRAAIRWKTYGVISSGMLGRICYRMCQIICNTPPSDYAESRDRSDTPDVPDVPDAEQDEDLPAYPGIEISVVDEH